VKAILDTHTFLWWNLDDPQLSKSAREFIGNGRNQIYLSAVSAWEISLKYAKGRLELPEPPGDYVMSRLELHQFLPLSIELTHTLHIYQLPAIHHDPFDRLLVAQAQLENCLLITADRDIARYNVNVLW
jgi:PIN domain nuclease of toxin-antitoxin system